MRIILIAAICTAFIASCNTSGNKKALILKDPDPQEQSGKDATAQQYTTIQNPDAKLYGIDISHHQTEIIWDSLKPSRVSFIFIKATGGMDYTDPEFGENWKNVKQMGLPRGAYHFYYSVDDPEKQAQFFSETVLAVSDSTDLPPVLDIETHGVNSNISIVQYQKDVKTWLELTEKAFNRKPVIYTSKNFANKYLKDSSFSDYHLWLAEYEVDTPVLPEIWAKTGWTFWQNSYSDSIPGIRGGVDHNIFKGTMEDLRKLGREH